MDDPQVFTVGGHAHVMVGGVTVACGRERAEAIGYYEHLRTHRPEFPPVVWYVRHESDGPLVKES